MKRNLLILCISSIAWCSPSIAQKPGVVLRNLSESGNTKTTPAKLQRGENSNKSHSIVLTPPDTTKMARSRKVVFRKEIDSVKFSAMADSVGRQAIMNRWKRNQHKNQVSK